MLAPVLLLEVRKLLEQQPPTRALEPLHDLANVLMCPVADEHVHVVCCDLAGDDVNSFSAAICRRRSRTRVATQHPLAVFGTPHQVNLEVVLCVTAESISSHSVTSST